jgi:hypothetical protein
MDKTKIIEQKELIIRKTGRVILNPKLFNNKSMSSEQSLLIKINY